MRISLFSPIVVALVLAGAAQPARAQSLADVAKKEEDRRKAMKGKEAGIKTYTNKDLGSVPAPASPPPEAAKPATAPADAAKEVKAEEPKQDEPKKDQAYWAGRMKDARDQLDRDQTYAEALQSRINALTNDFSARDDPFQRAKIGTDRQKAIAELDRLKKSIEDGKKAIADLEEEARRAGVPAGWLR